MCVDVNDCKIHCVHVDFCEVRDVCPSQSLSKYDYFPNWYTKCADVLLVKEEVLSIPPPPPPPPPLTTARGKDWG